MAIQQDQLDKSHLTPAFIQKQRKKLEQKLAQLIKKQQELVEFPDIGDSPDDTAQEAAEYEGNINIKKNVDQFIKRVQAALKRIDKGTYGICKRTGQPIEKGRLEIMPEAEYAADAENSK